MEQFTYKIKYEDVSNTTLHKTTIILNDPFPEGLSITTDHHKIQMLLRPHIEGFDVLKELPELIESVEAKLKKYPNVFICVYDDIDTINIAYDFGYELIRCHQNLCYLARKKSPLQKEMT